DRDARAHEGEQHGMVLEEVHYAPFPLTKSAPNGVGAPKPVSQARERIRSQGLFAPVPYSDAGSAAAFAYASCMFATIWSRSRARSAGTASFSAGTSARRASIASFACSRSRPSSTTFIVRFPLFQLGSSLAGAPVPARRDGEDGLDEDVGDRELLERRLQLP